MGNEQELFSCISYSALPCLGCEEEHQHPSQHMSILGISSLGSPLALPQHSCGTSKEQLHTWCAHSCCHPLDFSFMSQNTIPDVCLHRELPYLCRDWNIYQMPSKINGRVVKVLEILAKF